MKRLRSFNFAARESHPFVVLRENQLAYSAATRQINNHSAGSNLVFVKGEAGFGKSHLTRQIARTLAEKLDPASICLTSGDRLLEDLKRLNFAGKLHEALLLDTRRDESRSARTAEIKVLICDDVDHIAKSLEAQRLLCVVLDQLLKRKSRVVFTADENSLRTSPLSRRLMNRLQSGVQATIEPLSSASRARLLEQFCSVHQVPLEPATIRLLAEELNAPPGQLWNVCLELKEARDRRRAAEAIVQRARASRPISLDRIASAVADVFDVKREQLNSSRRLRSLVIPRQMAMHIARELTRLKLVEIGQHFGNRNHSTVVHACRKLEQRMKEDARLRRQRAQAVEALRPSGR